MHIAPEWRLILRRAWSIRFIALAGLLSGAEVALPYLSDWFRPGVFAALGLVVTGAAFVARITVQKDIAG